MSQLMNESLSDRGVCIADPGFLPGSANKEGRLMSNKLIEMAE